MEFLVCFLSLLRLLGPTDLWAHISICGCLWVALHSQCRPGAPSTSFFLAGTPYLTYCAGCHRSLFSRQVSLANGALLSWKSLLANDWYRDTKSESPYLRRVLSSCAMRKQQGSHCITSAPLHWASPFPLHPASFSFLCLRAPPSMNHMTSTPFIMLC